MNVDQLRTFLVVAECGTISRAVERLPLTQSAVSRQIQALEREVNATLFSREGRALRLTDVGRLLMEEGQRVLRAITDAREALDALKGLGRGQLRVGAASTIGTYLLPPALGRFREAYPGVDITLEIANKARTLARLLAGDIDLGFSGPPIDAPDLVCHRYLMDELVLITAPAHPLAARSRVRAAELEREVFLTRERGSGTREIIEEEMVRAGLRFRRTMELGSTEAIKQAVAFNLGVSLVSRYAITLEVDAGRLAAVHVRDLRLTRQLYAISHRRRPLPRAAAAFLASLHESQPAAPRQADIARGRRRPLPDAAVQ